MRTHSIYAVLTARLLSWCAVVALASLGPEAYALDPHKSIAQYAHAAWNSQSGLPEADVMTILQTKDGYLWAGTEEGLVRFDGARFTVYDRKTARLPDNRIQALAETPDGSLWIGTENGLSCLRNHGFTNYSTRDGLPSDTIRALWAEPGGPLWITTTAGVRAWRTHGFERDHSIEKMARGSFRQLLRTPNGDTWLAGDKGLTVLPANGAGPPHSLAAALTVRALLRESPAGTLWIGSTAGLYRIINGRISAYDLDSHARHPEITALLQDRDHNVWVGTLGDGLFRINPEGVRHYSVSDGLSGVEVKCLYEDGGGNLWVGTFGGMDVFRDAIFTPFGKREGLNQELVWTVMEGGDSSIWAGTQSGGLYRLKDGKVTVYATGAGFADNTVGSLFEGRDGTLWLGKDSGLSRFEHGSVAGAPPASPPLREQVHAIYEDGSHAVWIGTRSSGLAVLRGNKYTYLTTRDGLAGNNVQTIIPSRHGGLWIGTLGGLSRYRNGSFTNLTSKDGLSADQVISLYEDAEGALWIGTDGLNRLKDGKITTYGDREGLFLQNPMAILEDDRGYLWLSTNKGIFRVSKEELNEVADGKLSQLSPVAFGVADGMRSAECNGGSAPSGWKDRNGNLWFATVAGVLKLDPRRVAANTQPLHLNIEDLWADKTHIDPRPGLRLPPGGHELEFHYSAPYFAGADRIRYKYRLEGFDKDWVDAGTRTAAYYTNLPPGNYRFRVAAATLTVSGEQAEAQISFDLLPHFYQTSIFETAAVLAALGLVLLVWLWTHRLMIARQNELRRLVKARTRELEAEKAELLQAKAILSQQATHDFLTGLMNRGAIFRVLEQEMIQARREGTRLAVLLADLDYFKAVNDTYGHLVGDDVLREFARRLKNNLRPYDHAGRLGGEEFLIIMPGLYQEHEDRIHGLHEQLCQKSLVSLDVEVKITCSIGVAWFDPEIEGPESLLKLADMALYAAKANGRNRVEIADTLPHGALQKVLQL
ncbi:MAG TPA: two-component regulator propeller domain-containing protein [Bryobacteraceae bacterium]|nr:two-component regulator propeller domain-containing protein [Bryobacteraceae bacterium]